MPRGRFCAAASSVTFAAIAWTSPGTVADTSFHLATCSLFTTAAAPTASWTLNGRSWATFRASVYRPSSSCERRPRRRP